MSFADLLKQITQRMRAMMRHQRYRGEDLRHDLGLRPGEPNIYGMAVNVMSFDYDLRFAGNPTRTHNLSNGPVDELSIIVYDRRDGSELRLDFDANPAHYVPEELAAHQRRFLALLPQLARPDRQLRHFDILASRELHVLLEQFKATTQQVPRRRCMSCLQSSNTDTP